MAGLVWKIFMSHTASITSVSCKSDKLKVSAQIAAEALQVDVGDVGDRPYTLVFAEEGVYLQPNDQSKHGRIMVDFCRGSLAHRRVHGGGKNQMIAKAVGLSKQFRPSVIDATAGLGKDAFVLASLGCEVTMMERSPVAFALLEDGLRRARLFAEEHDAALFSIMQRMVLRAGDSMAYLQGQEPVTDVIYLDPMFPERQKQAAVKKDMQAFHTVIGPDADAAALLHASFNKAQYRIVVKRPRVAPNLGDVVPSYTLQGKSSRYDVYTFKGVPKG